MTGMALLYTMVKLAVALCTSRLTGLVADAVIQGI
jgi:hypothetical protein